MSSSANHDETLACAKASAADADEIIRLREIVYVGDSQRIATTSDLQESFDGYREFTTEFVVRSHGRLVGTVRVIRDSPAGLPCGKTVDFAPYRSWGSIAEFGHLLLDPEFRNSGAILLLLREAYRYCRYTLKARFIFGDIFVDTTPDGGINGFYKLLGFSECGPRYPDNRFLGSPMSVVMVFDDSTTDSRAAVLKGYSRRIMHYLTQGGP